MSPIFLLSLILQVGCCVHVVRSGRPLYWVLILLMFSYLAVLVYVIVAVVPDMRMRRSGDRVLRKVRAHLDPGRDARAASLQAEVADTPENRRRLAIECLRTGDFAGAEQAYRRALRGIYAHDPDMLLGLARAQLGLDQPADALATLTTLAEANPGYRSYDADLLHANLLDILGRTEEALRRFEAVAPNYPGEEARVRLGQLLRQAGHTDRAAEQFRDSIARAQAAPAYYQREQKAWLEIARRELATLTA
ncbi:tetratricopeptide repeat protein [Stenotrophomonas sp.]|uniref:tetratricopeptide repeat protein n=1 Tax=Stenotrophomonas sp. TaxID=69392 RepID=UPI002FC5BE7C